jgi:hypothetical protein
VSSGRCYNPLVNKTQGLRRTLLVTRALASITGRNQYVKAGLSAAKTVGASAKRATHMLWLQVTGLFFILFALIGILAAVREFQRWQAGEIGISRIGLAILFTVIFSYFAVSSFGQARRMERDGTGRESK